MKLIFKNKATQKKMKKKLSGVSEKTIETENGLEVIQTYEFKDEILRSDRIQGLIDQIRVVETHASTGAFVKAKDTTAVLKDYESENTKHSAKSEQQSKISDFYQSFNYKTKGHIFLFDAPNYILEDNKSIEEDLFEVTYDIVKNTENNIVYDNLIKEPLKNIEITAEKTGQQLRKELKEFCNSVKIKNKKVYMTFNLFSDLETLSKKLDTPLITDNPNILGGKLLVGVPIVALEEETLKQYNQKELIICGDLYNSFALVKNPEYEFDFTNALKFGYTSFRVIQNYDFKKTDERIAIGQIAGIETILNK